MDLRKLKSLIELFESSGIGELEIAEGEERVRITRASRRERPRRPQSTRHRSRSVVVAARSGEAPEAAQAAVPAEPEGHVVKSPDGRHLLSRRRAGLESVCRGRR